MQNMVYGKLCSNNYSIYEETINIQERSEKYPHTILERYYKFDHLLFPIPKRVFFPKFYSEEQVFSSSEKLNEILGPAGSQK